jgi:hypothetical protein
VSGYDTESDNEEEEEQEVMDVEKKPDFIGPRIPEVNSNTVTKVPYYCSTWQLSLIQ